MELGYGMRDGFYFKKENMEFHGPFVWKEAN
jgi:hypothetical protein